MDTLDKYGNPIGTRYVVVQPGAYGDPDDIYGPFDNVEDAIDFGPGEVLPMLSPDGK